jgi:hypothetical protein
MEKARTKPVKTTKPQKQLMHAKGLMKAFGFIGDPISLYKGLRTVEKKAIKIQLAHFNLSIDSRTRELSIEGLKSTLFAWIPSDKFKEALIICDYPCEYVFKLKRSFTDGCPVCFEKDHKGNAILAPEF